VFDQSTRHPYFYIVFWSRLSLSAAAASLYPTRVAPRRFTIPCGLLCCTSGAILCADAMCEPAVFPLARFATYSYTGLCVVQPKAQELVASWQ